MEQSLIQNRSLYLSEKKGMIVRRDGPSLWIKARGEAGQRVPARLIKRVIITGNVRLDAGAITLFAERGVPVAFLNQSGEILATAAGVNISDLAIAERQKELLSDSEGCRRSLDWIYARRQNLQLQFLKEIAPRKTEYFELAGFRDEEYSECIKGCAAEIGKRSYDAVQKIVHGLFYEFAAAMLLSARLNPHLGIEHRHQDFGLVKDICYILHAEEDRQTIRFLKADGHNKQFLLDRRNRREIVQRFENDKARLTVLVDSLLDDIFELMRETA